MILLESESLFFETKKSRSSDGASLSHASAEHLSIFTSPEYEISAPADYGPYGAAKSLRETKCDRITDSAYKFRVQFQPGDRVEYSGSIKVDRNFVFLSELFQVLHVLQAADFAGRGRILVGYEACSRKMDIIAFPDSLENVLKVHEVWLRVYRLGHHTRDESCTSSFVADHVTVAGEDYFVSVLSMRFDTHVISESSRWHK